MLSKSYTKTPVNIDSLTEEIRDSDITIALDYITVVADSLTIVFKADLSSNETDMLDDIVSAHTGEPPSYVNLVSIDAPKDTEGSLLNRIKLTKTGWHYEPRLVGFRLGGHKSLHNRKHDGFKCGEGTDWDDATLHFFDENGDELTQGYSEEDEDFQTRLDQNCTCTVLYWQPQYDMEIISGGLSVTNNTDKEAIGWFVFAPDIPEIYGGNVPFITGGIDFDMITQRTYIPFDGETPKYMGYDPVYNSNKAMAKINHGLGVAIKVQLRFEHYRG